MTTSRLAVLLASIAALFACQSGPTPTSTQAGSQAMVTTPAPEGAVPAGTRIMIRTTQALDSRRQGAGTRFTAILEGDLANSDGEVIAEAGSTVYGQLAAANRSGRLVGKTNMTLILTDIRVDNQLVPIRTSEVKAVGEGTGGGTVRSTAGGAAVGGIANGSTGARRGAAIGLGMSVLSQGNQIVIPSGTIQDFQLADHLVR